MSDTLPVTLDPDAREGILGFVHRLAHANGVSTQKLLHAVERRRPSRWSDGHWKQFRWLANHEGRFDEAYRAFSRPTLHHRWDRTAVEVLGAPMRGGLLAQSTRVCPTCLGESGCMKEVWNVQHAVACATHGTLLVDRCDCGRQLGFNNVQQAWTCLCGRRWADLPVTGAPAGVHHVSCWLASIFGEANVDPNVPTVPIPGAGALDLIVIIETIARAVRTDPDDDTHFERRTTTNKRRRVDARDQLTVAEVTSAITTAHPYLAPWPTAYLQILDQVACRNLEVFDAGLSARHGRNSGHVFATEIGDMLRHPPVSIDGRPNPFLVRALNEYCLDRFGIPIRKARPSSRSDAIRRAGSKAGISEIARRLGLSINDVGLRRAYDSVALSLGDSELSADEIFDLVASTHRSQQAVISCNEAAAVLDTPGRNLDAWVAADLLDPLPTPAGTKAKREAFHVSDVEALSRRLAALAEIAPGDDPAGYMPYPTMARIYHSAAYTKPQLLRDVFEGRIKLMRRSSHPPLPEYLVEERSIADCAWAARLHDIFARDPFVPVATIQRIVTDLWTDPLPTDQSAMRALRREGQIRTVAFENSSDGRVRPGYRYSLVDALLRQCRSRPTGRWPIVDKALAALAAQ